MMPWGRHLHEWIKRAGMPVMLRVRHGPLQGKRWIITSGKNFLTGNYEPEKTAAVEKAASGAKVIVDVGAHIGYFTVLLSDIAGQTGRVYAFEPRGLNLAFLKRHLKANGCDNVTVFEACVGKDDGRARLETRTGTGTGHVSATGNVEVDMVSLDALVEAGRVGKPDFVKIDVEGGEMDVLKGGQRTIEKHHPTMVIATHSDELDMQVQTFLRDRGYRIEEIPQPKGDKEMIAVWDEPTAPDQSSP